MEQTKKRRNSILKKPPANEEDTTGDVTTKIKRRISFSGKKSVKEFIPGEEEATIWGTSYEESADCLQGNSTESGLVNVHEKRIVLRNRRVVVNADSSAKRRYKKKAHVAENDKENVFVPESQHEPMVKVESPMQAELTLVNNQKEEVKTLTVPETVDRVNMWSSTFDFINCSAPINKTITIENSVDVTLNENEMQMLKFRIPVTATDVSPNLSLSSSRDGSSPNIFSCSILMSEEDVNMLKMMRGKKDVQGAESAADTRNKEVEVDMENTLIAANEYKDKRQTALYTNQSMNMSLPDAEVSKRKTITNATDMEADRTQNDRNRTLKGGFMNLIRGLEAEDKKRTTMYANQTMNVSQCEKTAEVKSLKRKTITKAVNMEGTSFRLDSTVIAPTNGMDYSSMDINSPIRKKPMHNTTSKPMDITTVQSSSQVDPIRRQTIHFESATVDESLICNLAKSNHESMDVPKSSSKTIHFDENAPRPVAAQIDNNISMELSVCESFEKESITTDPSFSAPRINDSPMNFTIDTSKRRLSIHVPDDMIEDSPKATRPAVVLHQQTIRTHSDMIEDSPKATNSIIPSIVTNRHTIFSSTDILEETLTTSVKQSKSIYTPIDILEDSPKATQSIQLQKSEPNGAVVSAPKARQSIYISSDIVEDSPKVAKTTGHSKFNVPSRQTFYGSNEEVSVQPEFTTAKVIGGKRESIYTPTDIIEDSPKAIGSSQATKTNVLRRQTTFTPTDINQDCPQASQSSISASRGTAKQRQSIYTSSDMNLDSPKAIKPSQAPNITVLQRQSIYIPSNMQEDSPKAIKPTQAPNISGLQYQSTYISSDMQDDSPKAIKPTQAPNISALQRQSIYIPSDMHEDSPKAIKPTQTPNISGLQRQSIYIPSDMHEDSPKAIKLTQATNISALQRQSTYTPSNMHEESPKAIKPTQAPNISGLQRQSIYIPSDMHEDSPKAMKPTQAPNISALQRQSIYTPSDMHEDSPKAIKPIQAPSISALQRQSVYTPSDIHKDSPKAIKPIQAPNTNTLHCQSIYNSADMNEESPKVIKPTQTSKTNALQRQSIYTSFDMNTNSPIAEAQTHADMIDAIIPPTKPSASAPKVIVKHLNLQQAVSGNQAALRILKNQQAKQKPKLETRKDDSFMDMSVVDEVTKSTNKMNFHQLNEEMIRGEAKAFAKERKERMSLFNHLEEKSTEELKFDFFMDKPSTVGCVIQPARNSMKDYTMELSMGKTLNNQKGRESEYSMDLTLGKIVRHRETTHNDPKTMELKHPSMNPLRDQVTLSSNTAEMNVSIDMQQTSPSNDSNAEQSKRQTIHFSKPIDLDQSTNPLKKNVVSQTKRQTIHFNQEIDIDESKVPLQEDSMDISIAGVLKLPSSKSKRQTIHCSEDVEIERTGDIIQIPNLSHHSVLTETKRQMIHFNQSNNLEQSLLETRRPLSSGIVTQTLNNDSTMDLSMNQVLYSDQTSLEHQSAHCRTVFSDQNLEQSTHVNAMQVADKNQSNENTVDLCNTIYHEYSAQHKPHIIHGHKITEMNESNCSMATFDVARARVLNQPRRQTIHCNEDLELEDTTLTHSRVEQMYKTSQRQTLHFNDDLEIENTNEEQFLSQTGKQQTIHFNQDLVLEDLNNRQKASPQVSKPFKRQTLYFNQDLDVEDFDYQQEDAPQTCNSSKRQTLNFNQDLKEENAILPKPSNTSKRHTLFFNEDLEEEDTNQRQVFVDFPKTSKRQTLHFNQDLEVEDYTNKAILSQPMRASQLFKNDDDKLFNETKRNTAENALISSKSNRRTVHFQENIDLEDSVQATHDDSTMDISITHEPNLQDEPPKALPLPRRLTIHDEQRVNIEDSPQKLILRKSSFSRTLNFNEMPSAKSKSHTQTTLDMGITIQDQATAKASRHTTFSDDNSPLYYYNSKSKGSETTAEIDRSLAEYLKAEAAATLFRNNSPDMRMDVVVDGQKSPETVYNNLENEFELKSRRETSHEPVNVFEESGMQPLLKRQTRFDSDNTHASHVELQTQSEIGRQRNPTEDCDNSIEFDIRAEKPFKSREGPTRKTIHFTNENAVDESFFDENLSKPALSQNRKTLLFNDSKNPIGDMEVTLSVSKGKSPAIQNLKQILQESNMLFTQSKLSQAAAFNNNRSTIHFAGRDNLMDITTANESMECESPKGSVECTPTKSKLNKSRIPQLIDSARKVLSMKKSMEFIQQELPNLGRANNMEESFDNVQTDISCRASTFKSRDLQESFDTIEIPRIVTTHIPRKLEESFDTIEIPRRATTFQRNETLYLGQNEVDITNISQKSLYKFEDAPITISDVSTFFAQKLIPTSGETNETYSPNTTEALCNLDVNRIVKDDPMPKSSDSEDTAYNFDKFKKRYVELTCDSIVMSSLMEDIEKTHLSLVNTLDEQSEVVNSVCPQPPPVTETEPNKVEATAPAPMEPLKPVSSVCRKCKRHRLSVTQNNSTIGSFMVEPLPEYKMDLTTLQDLATKPKISDIAKVWQQKMRESDSFNMSDGSRSIASDDNDSIDDFIAALDNKRLIAAQQRRPKEIKKETSFVHRVREKMYSNKSNWILNELLLNAGVLKFTHTRIRTFAIFIRFTPKDPRGIEVSFNEIQLISNILHSRQWTPFDYALHYQLFVELPFDLRKLCPTSEDLFQLLEHVEQVTQDVLKTGKDMLYLVLTSPASLIRESSGNLYIRKYARTKTPQNEVKRTEFQIEVRNIKKLSYESIAVPPLYEFDEKIQLLPVGQDFLKTFLADPMRYMKTRAESNSFV